MYLFCSQGLADNTVIAKVNKMVWDLDRPLEEDCTLELLKFEDEEAQAVSVFYQNLFTCKFALSSALCSYLHLYCVQKTTGREEVCCVCTFTFSISSIKGRLSTANNMHSVVYWHPSLLTVGAGAVKSVLVKMYLQPSC